MLEFDKYPKHVELFADKSVMLKSLKLRIDLTRKQTITFNLFDNKKQKSVRNLSKEFASFLGFQLLMDILKRMPRTDQCLHEMLEKCADYYQSNISELRMIEQFRMTYTTDRAVEWYTANSFVYRLINKALRTEDIELLYLFRPYIIDLCSQLEREHQQISSIEVFIVYRGQIMSTEEFEKLKQNVGILVSVNGFFSTSRDLNVALSFIAGSYDTDERRLILFEITIDPQLKSVIFADIEKYSHMEDEQEVLFSLGAAFIITQIQYDSLMNLWRIQMTATDEGLTQVDEYLITIRKQMEEEYSPTILFGCILWRDIGEVDRAEKYFKTLLKSLPTYHEDIPSVYHQMGCVYLAKDDFDMALDYYTQAYNLRCQYLPSDHYQIAASLNNLGIVHEDKQNYDLALEYCKQALVIFEKNHPGDHLNKAKAMMNIGVVLRRKKDYDDALEYLTKSLQMHKRVLPESHHSIARCLCNIGAVYEDQLKFDQALEYHHKTYEMNEKVLSSDHIYLTKDLNGIVDLYKKKGEYEKAIHFCRKKLDEQLNNLSENHPRIGHTLKVIGDIYYEQNNDQAFEYYHKALAIFENCIPSNKKVMLDCLEHISDLYYNRGLYDDALIYRKKLFAIQEKPFSLQHSTITVSLH
ncbi:unnamed protein product [Rotaria sordida]|uniref:Multifunctional fusion protein n=1 Tax=Rotaria sordida TaxID=392033 RepID=A0A819C487_9BILA|nr:unnamed protein product [Rotaria sordida]CAF3811656.1 unnamed protein product [Rotaria sordida]